MRLASTRTGGSTLAIALLAAACAAPRAGSFDSPEEAVHRLLAAADDPEAADELLGPGGFAMLRSGDEVADRQDLEAVAALCEERVAFHEAAPGRMVALLGEEEWELPIPLVLSDGRWRFDVEEGREEILNRRVGRNELSTLATLRALVEAQREYAALHDDGATRVYAQRLFSGEGERDGLFWPAEEGEPESPIGELLATAAAEGYARGDREPVPYHGYHFRLLTAQGPSAPGGALSYLDAEGRLTGGFAFVAWPATWGNSGVMTFVVNQQGIVFEKDLGPDTAERVADVRSYDPDESWVPSLD